MFREWADWQLAVSPVLASGWAGGARPVGGPGGVGEEVGRGGVGGEVGHVLTRLTRKRCLILIISPQPHPRPPPPPSPAASTLACLVITNLESSTSGATGSATSLLSNATRIYIHVRDTVAPHLGYHDMSLVSHIVI